MTRHDRAQARPSVGSGQGRKWPDRPARSGAWRALGSGHHPLTKVIAAVAAVFLALTAPQLMPSATASPSQTVVNLNGGLTPADLVDLLAGDGTVTSNPTITGSSEAIGTFDGFASVGFESGVVMSTGRVNQTAAVSGATNPSAVPGPNLVPTSSPPRPRTWAHPVTPI